MTEKTFFIHEIENKYDQESKIKIYPKVFTDQSHKRKWRLIA